MSLTYSSYVTTIANLIVMDESNTDFVQILPLIIDYAEGRIYRDLDLLSTSVTGQTTLNSNTRDVVVSTPVSGPYVILDQVNILNGNMRTPLTPVSREVLDLIWPGNIASMPQVYAMTSANSASAITISVGPLSSTQITLETLGSIRPVPLSASNTSTYLTALYPEIFVAASMVFASGWQKNFGSQSDDPKMSVSWESQYQTLLQGANQDSAREQFAGASWTSKRVEPFVQPQRG